MDLYEASKRLDRMGRHGFSTDAEENEMLKEAAAVLMAMALTTPPARVLTWEEIGQLPDWTVLWEECVWRLGDEADRDLAPVAKVGVNVVGSGLITAISKHMGRLDDEMAARWWNTRPSEEEMEGTPW